MEFTLEGEIGWAIGTWEVKNILNKAAGKDILINFSSPGGSVFTGLKMFNLFKNYKGKVDFHLVGESASMGSYIPLAASGKITAEPNVVYMIHNARSFVGGDHHFMRKRADIIEGLSNILKAEYVKRTGKKESEIAQLMDDETFFFGAEAVKAGFIDEVIGDKDQDPDAKITYIALAKESFESCMSKLNKEKPDDYEKAAAIIKTDFKAHSEHRDIKTANAENINKSEGSMDLKEAIDKHPAIDAQVKIKVQEAVAVALEDEKTKNTAIIARVAVVFDEQKSYPQTCIDVAVGVLRGEKDISVLDAVIAMHDMNVEKELAEEAKAESEGTGGEDGDGGETFTKTETSRKKEGVASTPEEITALAKADGGM